MMRTKPLILILFLLTTLLLTACGTPATSAPEAGEPQATDNASPETSNAEGAERPTRELRPVTLAMGYIPNVQFAPFYVAAEKGYFAEEGIDLTFDYGMENDLVQLVASDELQFAIASGDQVLLGRSRGLPVRYVANWYRRFPVAVSSLEYDLDDPEVLEGKRVGLPGLFGANYIGWLALAEATGIDTDTVNLEAIGFNQVPVLVEGQVDAVVVYATNEPVQLEAEGYEPSTIYVADYIDLVSNGLVSNETTIENEPELVQGMVRAILRGIRDTLDNPDEAFEIVVDEWVPEIGGENAEQQRAVLEASLAFWQNDRVGYVPRSTWESSQEFMLNAGLLDEAVAIDEVYTNQFVEQADIGPEDVGASQQQ
ncbi:MAG: ABC transporter substrate-binding protein [Chloroflexota bacterium]|nr:ABC transporter substrate-binding protein [Chloroflexota bacterium]